MRSAQLLVATVLLTIALVWMLVRLDLIWASRIRLLPSVISIEVAVFIIWTSIRRRG